MPPTLFAPISPAILQDPLDLTRVVVDPGHQRRDEHAGRDPGALELADRREPGARMRRVGLARPPGLSSSVGTERLATNSVRSAICLKSGKSRRRSGDFESTEHGFAKSRIASQMPGISRYFDSTHWYGSVFVPSATCSPSQCALPSSARTSSGALTLTTISRSKSSAALRSRYLWVGRAKQ